MNVADCKENSGLCSRRAPRITICLGYLYHNLLPAIVIALLQLAHTADGSPAHLSPPVGHSTLPAASGICLRQSYHCHCHPICQVPRFSLLPLLQSIYSSLSRLKAPSVALPHAGQRSFAERNTSGSASLASGAAVGLRAEQTVRLSTRYHTAVLWAAPSPDGIPTATQAASADALEGSDEAPSLSARSRRAARWAAASSCGTARAPPATPARPCAACCCCTCARSRCPAAG